MIKKSLDYELKAHVKKYRNMYEPGVLQPETHQRLVEQINMIIRQSNVPKKFITHSCKKYCSPEEMQWLQHYRQRIDDGEAGLCLTDMDSPTDHCMAIAGVLIRNFIDARVMTAQEVLANAKNGEIPECTVLLIPNFYVGDESGHMAKWDISTLYNIMLKRYTQELATIIYVENPKMMAMDYGKSMAEHVNSHFHTVGGY